VEEQVEKLIGWFSCRTGITKAQAMLILKMMDPKHPDSMQQWLEGALRMFYKNDKTSMSERNRGVEALHLMETVIRFVNQDGPAREIWVDTVRTPMVPFGYGKGDLGLCPNTGNTLVFMPGQLGT
jgi:hypothetical protein